MSIRVGDEKNKKLLERIKEFGSKNPTQAIWTLQKRLNTFLVNVFRNLGRSIGEKTSHFIIIPLLICCLCITGFQQLSIEDNFEELAIPKKGPWVKERKTVDKNFPMASLSFDPLRATLGDRYVNVLITSKTGRNLFDAGMWETIQELDRNISLTEVKYQEESFNYFDLCSKWKGRCFSPLYPVKPDILGDILNYMTHLPNISAIPDEPLWIVNFSLSYPFGGSHFNRTGFLDSAEAISLYYWLRNDHSVDVKRARKWEGKIMDLLSVYNSDMISVYAYASRTPSDELKYAGERVKPLLALSVAFILVFTSASASMGDWVRSKLLVSLVGIVSSLLATGAAFGILMYANVPFIEMNLATVFLMLGIGIDDMFVILAAWRRTSLRETIPTRMASTYEHSCVSITITSLTNMLAFLLGSFTSIRSIQIFCLYSCISVLMMLIVFLTFFGGCLAASGYLEKSQRHSLLFIKVLPKSESGCKSKWYRLFLSGGISPLNAFDKDDNQPHLGMIFIRNKWGGLLCKTWIKGLTVAVFMVYMIVSLYGVSNLRAETNPNRVAFLPSSKGYFAIYDAYFKRKPTTVQFVLTGDVDYSDEETKRKILALHHQLEDEPFVLKNFTISWIRDWYTYLEENHQLNLNITDEKSFVTLLRSIKDTEKSSYNECDEILDHFANLNDLMNRLPDFKNMGHLKNILAFIEDLPCNARDIGLKLVGPKQISRRRDVFEVFNIISWLSHIAHQHDDHYELDIKFNKKFSRIKASRFLMFVEDAQSFHVQRKLREIASRFPKLGVEVFSRERLIIDEIHLVKKTTIFTTLSTTLVVLLVSFILIPNPICSLWVASSIISIELGVVGLMTLWNVKLDAVSMVNLVMCVGFSVDFSAHICYAFLDVKATSMKERTRESLYSVGFPILLGGFSTIIGLVPLWFSDSSVFIKFFKIVFLVIALGMLHGMLFLPVFMSFMSLDKDSGSNTAKVEEIALEIRSAAPVVCNTGLQYLPDSLEASHSTLFRGYLGYIQEPYYDPEDALMILNADSLTKLFKASDTLIEENIKRF